MKRSRLRYASAMDILKMLAELHQERAQIEEVIIAIERLALGKGKRRGRPPGWMTTASAPKRRWRPSGRTNPRLRRRAEHREGSDVRVLHNAPSPSNKRCPSALTHVRHAKQSAASLMALLLPPRRSIIYTKELKSYARSKCHCLVGWLFTFCARRCPLPSALAI